MEITTNTAKHAEIELKILSQSATDPDNRPIIEPFTNEIIALCEAFGKSGQSGGSAPYTTAAIADAIKKLLSFKPIAPITGLPDEWMDVSAETGEPMFQNKRLGSLFKDGDGRPYYLDAIVWKTKTGTGWSGRAKIRTPNGDNEILSRAYVKSFPFKPKTFYIDVNEIEVAPDDWDFIVIDPSQLNRVWEYYDPFT